MARYFKKKRKNSGPNKNEEKVMRAAEARNQGGFASHLPGVKRLRIQMRFLSPQSQVLDEKALDLGPNDACSFEIDCPGRCGSGVFDFSDAVINAARGRQTVSECGASCQEPLFAGSASACGCQLKVRFELDYAPAADPAA